MAALILLGSAAHAESSRDKAHRLTELVAPDQLALKHCLISRTVELGGENSAPLDDVWEAAHAACQRQVDKIGLDVNMVSRQADDRLTAMLAGAVERDARAQASLALMEKRAGH